jgi:hypothetical protein
LRQSYRDEFATAWRRDDLTVVPNLATAVEVIAKVDR